MLNANAKSKLDYLSSFMDDSNISHWIMYSWGHIVLVANRMADLQHARNREQ